MQIAPFNYIRRSPNFEPARWPLCMSNQISSQSNLLEFLPQMREEHTRYISQLARHHNDVRKFFSLILFSFTL